MISYSIQIWLSYLMLNNLVLGYEVLIQSKSSLLFRLFITLNSLSTVPDLSLKAWFNTFQAFLSEIDLWQVPFGIFKNKPHDFNLTL